MAAELLGGHWTEEEQAKDPEAYALVLSMRDEYQMAVNELHQKFTRKLEVKSEELYHARKKMAARSGEIQPQLAGAGVAAGHRLGICQLPFEASRLMTASCGFQELARLTCTCRSLRSTANSPTVLQLRNRILTMHKSTEAQFLCFLQLLRGERWRQLGGLVLPRIPLDDSVLESLVNGIPQLIHLDARHLLVRNNAGTNKIAERGLSFPVACSRGFLEAVARAWPALQYLSLPQACTPAQANIEVLRKIVALKTLKMFIRTDMFQSLPLLNQIVALDLTFVAGIRAPEGVFEGLSRLPRLNVLRVCLEAVTYASLVRLVDLTSRCGGQLQDLGLASANRTDVSLADWLELAGSFARAGLHKLRLDWSIGHRLNNIERQQLQRESPRLHIEFCHGWFDCGSLF
jgi:hypothetical protein